MFVGGLFTQTPKPVKYDGFNPDSSRLVLGAISFPTSLDSLTNPSGTDSVATVSHSGQHSNANDALEALEAKVGTGASTAVNNTIFVGTGTGSSGYSTFATTTNLQSTNILATGSSTLQTTTIGSTTVRTNFLTQSATTTDFHSSGLASTTNLRANVSNIGQLTAGNINVTTCTGCSAAAATWYFATSSASTYKAKTLNLVAGDLVTLMSSAASGNLTVIYRISDPWSMASTTLLSGASTAFIFHFFATTTETVTFSHVGDAVNNSFTLRLQNIGLTQIQQF